ncbi:MAG: lysophospholipid acyltransferase family protein [Stenotrophobium sp.]
MIRHLRFLLILIGKLPLPLLHALSALPALLLWLLPNKLRRMTLLHLQLCLPELTPAQRRRIARRSLAHSMKLGFESPAIWFGSERRLRRWLDDRAAREQLQALIAGGKGVILLCPHLGAWELAGLFCASAGPMTTLYKPQKGALDALIKEGRERLGANLVPTAGSGVKQLLQALKSGAMIGILPDHDPPDGSGVFAPLFGISAHTTPLVGKLAARTGAPVWFCIAERLDFGRGYRIHLRPAPAEVSDADTGVAALNRTIEQLIREWPEQYWWSYRRYRRLPPGTPNPYQGL